ncbi:MAG: hypothetical protein GX166_09805 [Clostridiaceae bacterium]|nr:hypothetical protein [Clostridiaceae bacterium]
MRKTRLFTVMLIVCMLLLALNVHAANPPLEIDIEALQEQEGRGNVHIFSAAGYFDYVLQMGNIGDYHCLGEIDLSKYDTVTIRYGADQGAQFYDDEKSAWLALTTNGPTTDNAYNPIEDVEIIAKVNLENPYGHWAVADNEVVMELDTDYNGIVYLALTMAKIGDRQDGIAITEIIFSDSSYVPPTPEPTEEPSPTPDPTDTPVPTKTAEESTKDESTSMTPVIVAVVIGAVVIAVIVIVMVVLRRKKRN